MSTSLLYHAFGVRGYQYARTVYEAGRVRFAIRQPRKAWRCSACGSRSVRPRGAVQRQFRALPIGGRPVTIASRLVSMPASSFSIGVTNAEIGRAHV